MAFQLTPLHIPSLTTDFSAQTNATARLGEMLGNLPGEMQKQRLAQQKQQILGQIGTGNLDYEKAGRSLIALGDTQAGATLLTLGQKQQQLGAQKGIADIFSGGGAAPLGSTAGVGPASLIQNESGGNWGASNNAVGAGGQVGHDGRAQFGRARLQEAANAGAIPQGVSREEFRKSPQLQKQAESWHFGNIDDFIQANGYDKMIGQSINGVPITVDGMRAVAHLGGNGGLRKFIETGGKYNPSDANGTSLMDYFTRHGGNSTPLAPRTQIANPVAQPQQPVQVAENEADVQRLESQMPGYGGVRPAQVAQSPDLPPQGANAAPTQAPGFAVPGNMLPPNDPFPRVTTQQLYSVLQNPQASDGQRAMAKSIIDNRMKYSDENAPDKREQQRLATEQSRLNVEKTRRDVEGEGSRPMTPEERKSYNVPEGQAAYMKRNGDPGFGPAGTVIKNEPPPPAGMRYIRDAQGNIERMEAIPGSKAETEAKEAADKQRKAEILRAEAGTVVGNALDDIDRLASNTKLPVTGAIGSRLAQIPGTSAHDIAQALSTIGANITFDKLQQMREASPTGGALGAVSDKEGKLLGDSYAALSQSQSWDQFKTNLGRLRAIYERTIHGRNLTPQERKTGGPMTMERAKALRDDAAAAIAGGAPKDKVLERLKEYGISTGGL